MLNHRGFSGITSASLGILGFYISKKMVILWKSKNKKILLHASCFVFLSSLSIMICNLSPKLSILAFFGVLLIFTNIIFILKKEGISSQKLQLSKKELFQIIFGLAILFYGVLTLIPNQIVNESGSVVNIFAHLMGFIVGFWTFLVWDMIHN